MPWPVNRAVCPWCGLSVTRDDVPHGASFFHPACFVAKQRHDKTELHRRVVPLATRVHNYLHAAREEATR